MPQGCSHQHLMVGKSTALFLSLLLVAGLGVFAALSSPGTRSTAPETGADPALIAQPTPLPPEVLQAYTPLKFQEIFVTPVGPKGMEYSAKAESLKGRKVRMDGFMVKHLNDDPTLFMFCEIPTTHNSAEFMLADSLPVDLVHVVMDVRPGDAPIYVPFPLTVLGTLELGTRQEKDGRVSSVRLISEHVLESRKLTPIELRKPIALQKDRSRRNADRNLSRSP